MSKTINVYCIDATTPGGDKLICTHFNGGELPEFIKDLERLGLTDITVHGVTAKFIQEKQIIKRIF